jgi:hypothetical protein
VWTCPDQHQRVSSFAVMNDRCRWESRFDCSWNSHRLSTGGQRLDSQRPPTFRAPDPMSTQSFFYPNFYPTSHNWRVLADTSRTTGVPGRAKSPIITDSLRRPGTDHYDRGKVRLPAPPLTGHHWVACENAGQSVLTRRTSVWSETDFYHSSTRIPWSASRTWDSR